MYTIYCHIFPNGKRYIGITRKTVKERWGNGKNYASCPLVERAIKKYGWENIEHQIISVVDTKEDAEREERRLISEYKSDNVEFGYNILPGGNVSDNMPSEEMREKLGRGWRGKHRSEEEKQNRNIDTTLPKKIEAWTKYNFEARNNKYSSFKWNYSHFNGTDWDESGRKNGIFRFSGKHWDQNVDKENGNYDYLMGADIDFNNPEVVEELKRWGKWYLETTNVDAFRLDAVKHIK